MRRRGRVRLPSIVYDKQELARRLALELRLTPTAAADEVDRVVSDILKKLRKGRDARLRGVGILHPTPARPRRKR